MEHFADNNRHFAGCTFKPEPPEGCDLSQERILVHCCCAPCSTAIIEWMADEGLRPGIFFSNSNIVPFSEYLKRRDELVRYSATYGLEIINDDYDHKAWLEFVHTEVSPLDLAEIPERGPRCLACFKFRLDRAARYGRAHGYTMLTTTLASSRWKDLSQVDEAGSLAAKSNQMKWWNQNWRKGGLQERRGILIRECGLYNQDYCGCEFSERH